MHAGAARSLSLSLSMLALLSACGPSLPAQPQTTAERPALPAATPAAPASAPIEPPPAPPAAVDPPRETDGAAAAEVDPTSPAFDPLTVSAARVRVLVVHRDQTWHACGVSHATGVIEVEVLEVGEPAPRLLLIVSCPVDFGHRELLEVGAVLDVELYRRRQPWPRPHADRRLPAELPRRYVESMARAT